MTFHDFLGDGYKGVPKQIDHIYYNFVGYSGYVEKFIVCKDHMNETQFPSDHYPIIGEFTI